jgi:hypothetical protein
MSTPNQLSVTPRTDAAWAKTFEDDDDQCRAGNAATDMRDACATLERELAAEREKAERYRLASLQLDAELATERARLDWVFGNCKVEADDFTTGNRDVYAIHDREDLRAAMKENAT